MLTQEKCSSWYKNIGIVLLDQASRYGLRVNICYNHLLRKDLVVCGEEFWKRTCTQKILRRNMKRNMATSLEKSLEDDRI